MKTFALPAFIFFVLSAAAAGQNCQNGLYLNKAYTQMSTGSAEWTTLMSNLQSAGVTDLFVPKSLSAANLQSIRKNNPKIKVQAFVSRAACKSAESTNCFRLNDTGQRQSLVNEVAQYCKKMDGVNVDVEPIAAGNADYLTLLAQLRKACPAPKTFSIASYMIEPSEEMATATLNPSKRGKAYIWPLEYYTNVASHVDLVMIMNYDVGTKNSAAYQKWCAAQATLAKKLAAESGRRVQLGSPSYQNGRAGLHSSSVENFANATSGYQETMPGCPEGLGVTVYSESPAEMGAGVWNQFAGSWGPRSTSGPGTKAKGHNP